MIQHNGSSERIEMQQRNEHIVMEIMPKTSGEMEVNRRMLNEKGEWYNIEHKIVCGFIHKNTQLTMTTSQ